MSGEKKVVVLGSTGSIGPRPWMLLIAGRFRLWGTAGWSELLAETGSPASSQCNSSRRALAYRRK